MRPSLISRLFRKGRAPWIVAAAAVLVIAAPGIAIASAVHATAAATKGPIPASAWVGNGINYAAVPDYIPATDSTGATRGWVSKKLAIPQGTPDDSPIPVYADDLQTIVGHMYPGIGFVAVGVSPAAVPRKPVTVTEGAVGP
jgi:hypothetical protein